MAVRVAYFSPTVMAIDDVPSVQFSQIFSLCTMLHNNKNLNDAGNPKISIRGGSQVQVYPNDLDIDMHWLVSYIEDICRGYMKLVTDQSGAEELKYCKPIVTSAWTTKQGPGDYQELHNHPGGHISGVIYITNPDLDPAQSGPSDGNLYVKLPVTRDITKFIMTDTWKYAPVPGSVVLFPSYLSHGVYPWKGTGERMILAFDAIIVPDQEKLGGS